MVSGEQDNRGLNREIERQERERCPDQPQCPLLSLVSAARQLPTTTIEAPISINESKPNPTSATERAPVAAMVSTNDPDDIPGERQVFEEKAATQQSPSILTHSGS